MIVEQEVRCPRHPDQVTSLTCSRCGKPVCFRCMVYTPVGIRCRECASSPRSGVYAPSIGQIAKSFLAVLPLSVVLGALWMMYPRYAFWIALVLGFVGGEMISLVSGRKRGPEMQAVAAIMVLIAVVIGLIGELQRGLTVSTNMDFLFQVVMAVVALFLAVARQR